MIIIKKIVLIAMTALFCLAAGSPAAQAGPNRVATIKLGKYNPMTLRAYNNWSLATGGKDGHCYWGADNRNDFACTVDQTSDDRQLVVTSPYYVPHGYPGATKSINGRNVEYSTEPYFSRQLPFCYPNWLGSRKGYHMDDYDQNYYLCAYFKP